MSMPDLELTRCVRDGDYGNRDLRVLADGKGTEAGMALLTASERMRDFVRDDNERRPRTSDDISEDIRYRLGFVAGLNWVLGLSERARDRINKAAKGERK